MKVSKFERETKHFFFYTDLEIQRLGGSFGAVTHTWSVGRVGVVGALYRVLRRNPGTIFSDASCHYFFSINFFIFMSNYFSTYFCNIIPFRFFN
jgi:hypothetical protein